MMMQKISSVVFPLVAAVVHTAAQATTAAINSKPTLILWLPFKLDSGGYAASIEGVSSDTTTYALTCSTDCSARPPDETVAIASSNVVYESSSSASGYDEYVSFGCNVTTSAALATCAATHTVLSDGATINMALTTVYSGAIYSSGIYQLPIATGADKAGSPDASKGNTLPEVAPVLLAFAGLGALIAAIML